MGLFDIFKKREEIGIGIDIGSTAIKVAITSPDKKGGYKLKDVLIEDLPSGVVDKGDIKDKQEVLKKLKNINKHLPKGYVTYAFSSYKSTLFSFRLIKEVEDIEKVVEKELKHRIPLPRSELSVDYSVSELSKGVKVVSVVVGKRKAIEDTVSLLEDARIVVNSVTSTYTAIANTAMLCFPQLTEEEGGLVVDFGLTTSPCVCINQGIITHGGCIEAGVKILEDFIAESLEIDILETRKRLIANKIDVNLLAHAVLKYIDRVISEIDAYASLCQGDAPMPCKEFNLIGSGGGAIISELTQNVGVQLSEPFIMKILDPRKGFTMSQDVDLKLQKLGATRFSVALGASLL
ncbi:type IV pilus assembly protein PilM [Thermosulfidibacter takaii ABI70S6]|uniref:Type IV pilus assembly protein PilM n=1 Tax=Thermosulfidibacter takaii (strain DSM 17441 / JCM 13301 / NBRC 103674 / ABI70S6) TaxID=1298851 RepID=A0A0S3QSL5_THET7|nr:pilus assembly protein PilM [Thermosulfidibacter takaii]BAT71309.1 type IV pilus assembly protein PilM [Thermosulfidibacter takaii ABI70S6]